MFVPTKIPASSEKVEGEIFESEQPIDFLPWMDDMKQMFPAASSAASSAAAAEAAGLTLNSREFEEIYQHLRLTFATWFSITASSTLRQEVNAILFTAGKPRLDLTLMEKRQQLFIKLGNEILSWMDSTVPLRERPQTLKRVNCILQTKEACSDACIWKEDTTRCLLHTPKDAPIEGQKVDAQRFMVRKLLEELIRFPMKREELLKGKVPARIPLVSSFRSGDQLTVRETAPAWSEFLRMDWAKKTLEEPRYPEELLAASARARPAARPAAPAAEAAQEAAQEAAPAPAVQEPEQQPDLVERWLGAQASSFNYHSLTQINDLFGLPYELFEGLLTPEGEFADQESLTEFAKDFRHSLVQVDIKPEGTTMLVARCADKQTKKILPFFVFVRTPDSFGVLSQGEMADPLPFIALPELVKKKVVTTRVTVV